jgi:hypothetical protein
MKFKIKELEQHYKTGYLNKDTDVMKDRHDVIEEIYGIRPCIKFTHVKWRPLCFVESDIVYLEGEKFV